MAIKDFAAQATASPADDDRLSPPGPGGERLMRAALERFRTRTGADAPVAMRCETTVPRELGLGGSSAIVIACLRALCALHGTCIERDELAKVALEVETEDLGIAAGLQDRVVQCREALVAMEFTPEPRYEMLDPALLPPLFLAWHPEAAAPSGVVHARLRERHARGNEDVIDTLGRLADLAQRAKQALLSRDQRAFAACMDATFDERVRLMPVDPHTRRMIEIAREAGSAANSAGSGGSIVGTLPGEWPQMRDRLQQAGATAVRVSVAI